MSSPPETAAIVVNAEGAHMSAAGNLLSGNVGVQNINLNLSGPQGIDLKRIKPCPPASRVFTGREDALRRMKEYFLAPSDDSASKVFVLHGLGGAGKTQIARKFIHDAVYCSGDDDASAHHAPIVLVADASSAQNLEASFKDVAVIARIGEKAADLVAWLARHKQSWFLLLDNADDCDLDLHEYIPSSRLGNVIITTRNSEAPAQYTDRFPRSNYRVGDMTPSDARLLLRIVTQLSDSSNNEDLDALAEEVGYLALAIAQAGSAICRWKISVPQYLEELRIRRSEIFHDDGTRPQGVDGYHATVYTTWRMSYDRLSPLARQWFQICSFLHHANILEDIFRMAAAELPSFQPDPELPIDEYEQDSLNSLKLFLDCFRKGDGAWDGIQFRHILGEVSSYSLIEHFNDTCHIHPLVHQWTQGLIIDQCVSRATMFLLALSIKNVHARRNPMALYRIIHHIEHMIQAYLTPDQLPIHAAIQFRNACQEFGKYMEAMRVAQFVIDGGQRALGVDHPYTLRLMIRMAWILQLLGWLKEGEEMQRHVMERQKMILGEDHPDTLSSMSQLGWTLQQVGQLREAEEMQRHTIERRKVILGEDHPNTLGTMSNLGWTLQQAGQLREAEEMQRHTVKRWKVILGEDHPVTLTTMCNLGRTLQELGQLREAEEVQRHVLERKKIILGEDHPDTLRSLSNLGRTLREFGRLREAEDMQRHALERRKVILGEDHHDTLHSMGNLGKTLQEVGMLREAEDMQRHALERKKVVLGENHPETLGTMSNLGWTLQQLGRLSEAEEMQRHALDRRKMILGEDHPDTLHSIHNLTLILHQGGQVQEAETLLRHVIKLRRKVLGDNHPDTCKSKKFLSKEFILIRRQKRRIWIQKLLHKNKKKCGLLYFPCKYFPYSTIKTLILYDDRGIVELDCHM